MEDARIEKARAEAVLLYEKAEHIKSQTDIFRRKTESRNSRSKLSKWLSKHQKIKLMELACSLPQGLNGEDWKAHYKEMVELITDTVIQPRDTKSQQLEKIKRNNNALSEFREMEERECFFMASLSYLCSAD